MMFLTSSASVYLSGALQIHAFIHVYSPHIFIQIVDNYFGFFAQMSFLSAIFSLSQMLCCISVFSYLDCIT